MSVTTQINLECAGRAQRRRRFGLPCSVCSQSGIALRLPMHSNEVNLDDTTTKSRTGERNAAFTRQDGETSTHLPPEGGVPLAPARCAHSKGRAFTLIELLLTIAIIAVLAALLLPMLTRSKQSASSARCASNLHQLGLAAQMYWHDNADNCFRYLIGATNGGQLYWFGWLGAGAEGQRPYDATQGALYAYLQGRGVEICPSLNYAMARFKLKANGAAFGYGYNMSLSASPPAKISKLPRVTETALLADAAQVNDFQPPASRNNPMLEEFYYVDTNTNYPNGHFRHAQKANVVFCDGHVAPEKPVPGSLDARMPGECVGRLRMEILLLP